METETENGGNLGAGVTGAMQVAQESGGAGTPAVAAAPATDTHTATPDGGGASAGAPTIQEHTQQAGSHHILQSIIGALGGTEETTYKRDPQTGAMTEVKTPKGPGQQWKTIIAGFLTGAAGGAQARPGPGHLGRAAGAGFEAGANMTKGQDDQKYARANEDFDEQQKTTVRKAQTALLNQQVSELAFKNSRSKVMSTFEDSTRENAFSNAIKTGGQGSQDLGVAKSMDDVMQMHKDMPDLLKQQAHGNIIGIPHVNDQGQVDGMHYALVTPEWKSAKLDTDQEFFTLKPPTKPGEKPTVEKQTVKAGSMDNGDFWTARMAGEKQIMDYYDKQFTQEQETKREGMKNATSIEVAKLHEQGENERADKKATGGDKPVYAFDPKTNKTILTTADAAKEGNMQGVRSVKQSDIRNDQHDIRVLNDVSLKAQNVGNAASAMDDRSWGQAAIAAHYLADHPNATFSSLLKETGLKHATQQSKDYIVAVLNLRESAMGLNKVLTGTARSNETQLQAMLNTLPGVEPDSSMVKQKLMNFTQNITMLRQGLPELPGMDTIQYSPDSHVFSKAAWQKANPGGDINAAVAAAQKQGFQVSE